MIILYHIKMDEVTGSPKMKPMCLKLLSLKGPTDSHFTGCRKKSVCIEFNEKMTTRYIYNIGTHFLWSL